MSSAQIRWRQLCGMMAALAYAAMTAPVGAAESIQAESKIVAVTVFPDRAGVTRHTELTLEEGVHTVRLGPLPANVEPDSVTIKGSGKADVTLYGVRLATKQLAAAQDPKAQELEEAIRSGERVERHLDNTKRILDEEYRYLASIKAASSEQIGKDLVTKSPSASDAATLFAFLDESFLKTLARQEEVEVQLEANGRELDRLRRELAQLQQGRYQQEAYASIDLEAKTAGTFLLEVSYRVPGATWEPTYETRTSTEAGEVQLASYGMVRQRTGEAWTDVEVTLSTAKPALAGSMPEIQSWYLEPWAPPVPVDAKAPGKSKALMMRAAQEAGSPMAMDRLGGDGESLERNVEAQTAVAAVQAQGPAVTFALPKRESIASDWQPRKVAIGAERLKAALAYETTPRLAPYAYLRAKITNATDTFYLPGQAAVFLDGAFVATTRLEPWAPGEEISLYLGVDERVNVERRQLKERVEVSLLPGLRGKTKSIEYEFLTTIDNFTSRKIALTVLDQVPVSQREEIVVESVKREPDDVEADTEKPGVFRWQLEMGPRQKQELRLRYRVRHPVDLILQP